MPESILVDTCTLINFAVVGRLGVLEAVLDGAGRWTQAAAFETRRSARHVPALPVGPEPAWLGAPVELDRPGDARAVERLRRRLGGTSRRPLAHLAETEAIHLILTHPEFAGAVLLTDDGPAADFALRQRITVWRCADVLSVAHHDGHLGCPEAYELLCDMRQAGRGVAVPADHHQVCP
jgi:hypothetical protein